MGVKGGGVEGARNCLDLGRSVGLEEKEGGGGGGMVCTGEVEGGAGNGFICLFIFWGVF